MPNRIILMYIRNTIHFISITSSQIFAKKTNNVILHMKLNIYNTKHSICNTLRLKRKNLIHSSTRPKYL